MFCKGTSERIMGFMYERWQKYNEKYANLRKYSLEQCLMKYTEKAKKEFLEIQQHAIILQSTTKLTFISEI